MSSDYRQVYHDKIATLMQRIASIGALVPPDVRTVADTIGSPGPPDLTDVRNRHIHIGAEAAAIQESAALLIATQQPMAGDLRTIVSMFTVSAQIDRSGHLLAHVASIAERWEAAELTPHVQDLARQTASVYDLALDLFRAGDPDAGAALRAADDTVDGLSTRTYDLAEQSMAGASPRAIIDVGHLARHFERIADHAVTIGEQTTFIAGRSDHD